MQWNYANKYSHQGEYKRIETYAVEFDWIFRGSNAKGFIEHLARYSNDSIFAVETIKIIVTFLWTKFFYHIRNKIFIPFLIYFVLFLVQVTFIYSIRVNCYEVVEGWTDLYQIIECHDYLPWKTADYIFIALLFAFCLYFLLIEIRQFISLKY